MAKPIVVLVGIFLIYVCNGLLQATVIEDPLSDEFIDFINSIQKLWKAGRNFHRNTPLSYLKGLTGVHESNEDYPKLEELRSYSEEQNKLPTNFDAREHWPECPTIKEIRNQGHCGSCWAFGAVEAMSDRVCIHSKGTVNFYFSAQNLVSCCSNCSKSGHGCNGGSSSQAWKYWKTNGIVSGGPYNSHLGCVPYEFPPKDHYANGTRGSFENGLTPTPACVNKCQDGYKIPYYEDLNFGKSVYSIKNNEDKIKQEIYLNGPVEGGSMRIYEDFFTYKSGVYKHVVGELVGLHAVRILGWGVKKNIPYWLVANSWSYKWGQKGYFKILRGSNECGIEGNINAGIPAYK